MSKARKPQEGGEGGWRDQFVSSLRKWSRLEEGVVGKDPNDPDYFTRSLDRGLESTFPAEIELTDQHELFLAALRAVLHQEIVKAWHDLEYPFSKSESPIEAAMLFALTIVGREIAYSVIYVVRGMEMGGRYDPSGTLYIEPQAQLGEHRVDFHITYKEVTPDFSNPIKLPDGREIPGTKEIEKKMVLECDGHDYHDRTKEQARKDRGRDRTLQSLGYLVYRYTGSDIWSDVFRCAHQAVRDLKRQAGAE